MCQASYRKVAGCRAGPLGGGGQGASTAKKKQVKERSTRMLLQGKKAKISIKKGEEGGKEGKQPAIRGDRAFTSITFKKKATERRRAKGAETRKKEKCN